MDFNDIGANLSGGSYGFFIPKDPALRAKDLRPVPGVFFGGGTQPAGGGTQPAGLSRCVPVQPGRRRGCTRGN